MKRCGWFSFKNFSYYIWNYDHIPYVFIRNANNPFRVISFPIHSNPIIPQQISQTLIQHLIYDFITSWMIINRLTIPNNVRPKSWRLGISRTPEPWQHAAWRNRPHQGKPDSTYYLLFYFSSVSRADHVCVSCRFDRTNLTFRLFAFAIERV